MIRGGAGIQRMPLSPPPLLDQFPDWYSNGANLLAKTIHGARELSLAVGDLLLVFVSGHTGLVKAREKRLDGDLA